MRPWRERWRRAGAGGDVLVPVPVHEGRRRERGYDQAALITPGGRRLPGPAVATALVRTRATTAQYHLDRRHRASNVADAFAVTRGGRPAIAGRWVVLVDDVVTTGATLARGGAGAARRRRGGRERGHVARER